MLSGIDVLQWKFILRRKWRKYQKWASPRHFKIWQHLWIFEVFGNLLVTFCNFWLKKVCEIQIQISKYIYEVQFLTQSFLIIFEFFVIELIFIVEYHCQRAYFHFWFWYNRSQYNENKYMTNFYVVDDTGLVSLA